MCRHLNGDPVDNRIENLRWGTQAENLEDARLHGTASWFVTYGERNGSSKLTEEQVLEIEQRIRSTGGLRRLAREFDVSVATIRHIRDHRTWRHLWADTHEEFAAARRIA